MILSMKKWVQCPSFQCGTVGIVMLLLSSCTYTDAQRNIALGGKGAARGNGWSVVWSNEQSFRDGSMVAGLAIGAWQAVAAQKSTDALRATQSTNATKQAVNASNNATAIELGAQAADVEKTKILAP